MKIGMTTIVSALTLAASATVFAQNRVDRAFTATGESCDQVTWSQEALQNYPRIASACQEVVQRDGTYYVRFEGEVRRVADRGREVTINFRNGDRLTLNPPENMSLFIDGRQTRVTDLRPGDELNFYVPQNQLAASFYAGEPDATAPQPVPITPAAPEESVAAAATPSRTGQLPRTASMLPMLGFAGVILAGLGAVLTTRRRSRRSSRTSVEDCGASATRNAAS